MFPIDQIFCHVGGERVSLESTRLLFKVIIYVHNENRAKSLPAVGEELLKKKKNRILQGVILRGWVPVAHIRAESQAEDPQKHHEKFD